MVDRWVIQSPAKHFFKLSACQFMKSGHSDKKYSYHQVRWSSLWSYKGAVEKNWIIRKGDVTDVFIL